MTNQTDSQIDELAPKIKKEIEAARRILLHLHPNSDPDSVGAVLAMRLVLVGMGKEVTVIMGDNEPPSELIFLSGYGRIKPIAFDQINYADFDLFIALDASSPEQITDHVELNFPLPIPTIVIDHHITNSNYGVINLVDAKMSSTCELLFKLFFTWQVNLTADLATCLFVGIWGDTGGCVYASTTANTFATIAKLVEVGVDSSKVVFMLIACRSDVVRVFGKYLAEVESLYAGRVLFSTLKEAELLTEGLTENEVQQVIGMVGQKLSESNEVWLTVVLKERLDGQISLSLRSNNLLAPIQVNVGELAIALGGGGHQRAAGARFYGQSLDNVQKQIRAKIVELYPEIESV